MIDSADGPRSAPVAGALLGVHAGDALGALSARDGANAIPPKWLAVLQFAHEFRTAADQLTDTARQ